MIKEQTMVKAVAFFIFGTYALIAILIIATLLTGCETCANATPASNKVFLARLAASSVLVESEIGQGSGTVIWSNNSLSLILSCHHVVFDNDDEPAVAIDIHTNFSEKSHAVILDASKEYDLALLLAYQRIDTPALPIAKTAPDRFEKVFVVGAAAGYPGTVAEGILTSKRRSGIPNGTDLWQLTSFIFPGMSGGTVANEAGELTCVPESLHNYGGFILVPQLGFCVPLPTIQKFLKPYGF
jgi:S1-C subfamily serine protease